MHPGDIAQEPPGTTSTTSDKDKDNAFLGSDLSQVDKDLIFEGLKNLYKKKVLPLEVASKYGNFGSPPLGPSDFEAKPMVLILGQYSVGKTSFIRSLLKQDFPGQRIGPEPTTDRFTAIMHASDEGRLSPGHALVMQPDKPFRGLASFGNNFLSKFEGAEVPSSILRNITIVDTPGVLAGEKQRIGRDYDFGEIVRWFADRADMIIVMFDAHKLDISDELKMVLDALKPHHDKIRVLLNKADSLDAQSLLRVYGALMWSLGKVMKTPESCRVYLGSFWDAPLKREDNRALLQKEKDDLLNEMMSLPQNAVIRRINELVKRARSVKVHAYIIHYLRKQMPWTLGKADKQQELIADLDKQFVLCARRYGLPLGDFPDVNQYRKMLSEVKDISAFKKLDKSLVVEMDKVLTHDIPLLLQKATRSGGTGGTGGSPAAGVGVHRQQHPPNEPEQSHHGYHEQPQRQRPSKSFYQQAFGREQGGQHNPWS
jgi:EH domain-containing protein 1